MLKRLLKISVAIVVATAGSVGVAAAQSAAGASTEALSNDEVIVTARKRVESAQRVPVAITTFSGEQIADAHINTPVDLARFVPSLSVRNGFASPTSANFSLRGQQASDILLTFSTPIGLYEDSAAIPHAAGTNLGLIDLQRIEVLKGPQGTLYGRNTTGGAINIITRNADYNGVHGFMAGEFGNFEDRKLTAAVNVPIIDDVLSVRLAGQVWTRDGFGRSVTTGQDIGDDHNDRFARLSVLFDPAPNFTSTTKLEYNRADQHGLLNGLQQGIGLLSTGGLPAPFNLPPPSATNATGLALGLGDLFKTGMNINQHVNAETWHAVEDATWTINDDLRLRSITGYHRLSLFQNLDSDGSSEDIVASNIGDRLVLAAGAFPYPYREAPDQEYESYSQELDLSGRSFDRLDWVLGAFASTEVGAGGQPNTFLSTTKVTGVLLEHLRKSDWGVFTQDDLHLTDRMSLTLGARYSAERSSERVASISYSANTGLFTCALAPPAQPVTTSTDLHDCADITGSERANGISYLASFNFQVTPTQLFYIKTSRGFRGGSLQQRTASAPAARPEFATDYEIGLKSEFFDHRARFNIDYYHTDYENKQEQFSAVLPVFGITSVVGNAARAKIDGAEADGAIYPLPGLSLSGSMSYLWGEYTDYPCPNTKSGATLAPPVLTDGVCDLARNPVGGNNAAGYAFPTIPHWQYTLSGRYEHPLGAGEAALELDWTWTGKRVLNNLNDQTFGLAPSAATTLLENLQQRDSDSIGLLNGLVSYSLPDRQTTLSLFATNLLDEHYSIPGFSFNASSSGVGLYTSLTMAPRMWGVTLRRSFGSE